jgi:hypothetical protein
VRDSTHTIQELESILGYVILKGIMGFLVRVLLIHCLVVIITRIGDSLEG